MDNYKKNEAKVVIADYLKARGWTIYGYKENESDAMTDYFSPANWMGVAEKDGYVLCVSVLSGYAGNYSGKEVRRNHTEKVTCEACKGTKTASEWTLEMARKEPEKFHREWMIREYGEENAENMTILLSGGVVSPLLFLDSSLTGKEKCHKCHGQGYITKILQTYDVISKFPVFHPTAERVTWHLEKDGKIIHQSYEGLKRYHDYNMHLPSVKDMITKNLEQLEGKLRVVMQGVRNSPDGISGKEAKTLEGVKLRHNIERNGIEVMFPSKPSEEVIEQLKSFGYRWSRFASLWWNHYSEELWAKTNSFLGLDTPVIQPEKESGAGL